MDMFLVPRPPTALYICGVYVSYAAFLYNYVPATDRYKPNTDVTGICSFAYAITSSHHVLLIEEVYLSYIILLW